jgi:hypothetical protein
MEITKDTKVSEILDTYGDIADVMEIFGVKRVGGYSVRKYLTKVLTVQTAAKVHLESYVAQDSDVLVFGSPRSGALRQSNFRHRSGRRRSGAKPSKV